MATAPSQLEHASDAAVVDLLRAETGLAIAELAAALGVTPTAVRQRLDRLIRSGLVEKVSASTEGVRSRGRPAHAYRLTEQGRQIGGDNFRDLAMVLWREIREVREPSVRRGLFNRIGASLAGLYRSSVTGQTAKERLEGVAAILRDRDIPCSVGISAASQAGSRRRTAPGIGLPVLTSHACPFPELAEADRGICSAERLMIEELVGAPVRLSECRLDGDNCCRFTVQAVPAGEDGRPAAGTAATGLASNLHPASNPG